jgi:hypothetical protein
MNTNTIIPRAVWLTMALLSIITCQAHALTHTIQVQGINGGQAIAAGAAHTLVLKNDGTVVGFGSTSSGQSTTPAGVSGVMAIAAGDSHSLALKSDHTVVTWGRDSAAEFMAPSALTGVTAIAAGYHHGVALLADATVATWGKNSYGYSTVPPGLGEVAAVAAGDYHTLALKKDGAVVAWGNNISGQTVVPPGLSGVTAVAAGGSHSLALHADGSVVAWGSNSGGQCAVPPGLSGVQALAAGYLHSVALKADGTVVAWGTDDDGQAQVPAGLTGVVAIAAGAYHTLALTADGAVVAWGDNTSGQTQVPAGMSNTVTHGAILCPSPVEDQANALCTVAPDPGYHLTALVVNGVDRLDTVSANRFTIPLISSDQRLAVAFGADTPPGAPTITTVTLEVGQVEVRFSPPSSDGGRPITGYTVTASPGGGIQASGPGSPITISGLTTGATYTFTVTAINAVGSGPPSAPSTPVTINYQYGAVIDAPHTPYHGVTCADCHSYSLWWQYSPLSPSQTADYSAKTDALCRKCHGQGGGAINAVHSSAAMATAHNPSLGQWTTSCLACHAPHLQAQLAWRQEDSSHLFLATGTINGQVTYQAGESSFTYGNLVVAASAWDPNLADWGWKNPALPKSGLILVEDTASASNTFAVLSANPLTNTITVQGALNPASVGKGFGVIYGRFIRDRITTPLSGERAVKFYDPGRTHASGAVGGLTDPANPATPQGLCQVCHTRTQAWTTDGLGADHHPDQACTACHDVREGFRP